jgi:hypothetical protein
LQFSGQGARAHDIGLCQRKMVLLRSHLALSFLAQYIRTVLSDATPTPDVGEWFNPPDSPHRHDAQTLSQNPVYVVGETVELHWTTIYPNYTIALWQSYPPNAATRGPIIYGMYFVIAHRW